MKVGIPSDALAPLLAGSYENRTAHLQKLLVDSFVEYFDRPANALRILGTFENHAVVVTDSGEFRRVFYEMEDPFDSASVVLKFSESIAVPLVTGEHLLSYIKEQASPGGALPHQRLHGFG